MKPNYQRLPGTGHRHLAPGWVILPLFFVIGIFALLFRGPRVQLWRGKDHLLQVEWNGYRETYKRFRYADIQAFIFRKTQTGKIVSLCWAWFLIIFATLAFTSSDSTFLPFWALLATISLVGLILNIFFGPTCQCYLRTAVQLERLFSVTRVKNAQKIAGILRPLIHEIQGRIDPSEFNLSLPSSSEDTPSEAALNPSISHGSIGL